MPEYRHRGFSPEEIAGLSRPPHQTRVGANVDLPADLVAQGQWTFDAIGQRYWHVRVQSHGAKGLRLHLTDFQISAGKLWLHGIGSHGQEFVGPYQNFGPMGTGEFWTDFIFDSVVEVEYLPAIASDETVAFHITQLFHLWKDLTSAAVQPRDTGNCYVDATCELGNAVASEAADATALLAFSDHTCSGTLIRDKAGDHIPYLLTAGHCVLDQSDATQMIAAFQYRSLACGGPVPVLPSRNYVTGATLLVRSFVPGPNDTVNTSAPDFAFLRLTKLPGVASDSVGWNTALPSPNETLYSLSHPGTPQGYQLRYAEGNLSDTSEADFFGVRFYLGTPSAGSSGSGIFNAEAQLLGVDSFELISKGESVCSIPNPTSGFTRFKLIYDSIKQWIDPQTPPPPPPNKVSFSANPNPIPLPQGATAGQTTLSWNAPGHSHLVIRLKSATGSAMTGTLGSSGSAKTGNWVTDGFRFFLVDTDSQQSLASLTVHTQTSQPPPGQVTFTANPNPIVLSGQATSGQTTLTWDAPGHSKLVIRLKSPTGSAMTGTLGTKGSAKTGNWVTDGFQFFLVDVSTGASLASLTVHVTSGSPPPPSNEITFLADPNPIMVSGNATSGQTQLRWNAPGYSKLYIYANSKLITGALKSSGAIETGSWVTDGMVFMLLDGESVTTLAHVVVHVINTNPPPPPITDAIVGTYRAERLNDGIGLPLIQTSEWCVADPDGTRQSQPIEEIPNSRLIVSKADDGYLFQILNTGSPLPGYKYQMYAFGPDSDSVLLGGNAAIALSTVPWFQQDGVNYTPSASPYVRFTRDRSTGKIRVTGQPFYFTGERPAGGGFCDTIVQDNVTVNYYKDH